jgi:hypothetical protein
VDVRHSARGRASWQAGVRWLSAGAGDAVAASCAMAWLLAALSDVGKLTESNI